jgi:hypothetical protein
LAIHSLTGLASNVTAVPAAATSRSPRTRAVAHGEIRRRAPALTIGASVVPMSTAATTGNRTGRLK